MSKTAPAAATKDPAAPESFELSLDEFCQRQSAGDKRVELLSAFHYTERVAGRTKGNQADYLARYQEFAARPVA